MSEEILKFKKIESDADIRKIHEFNVKAFSDEDLSWTYDNLKKHMADNWILYTANYQKDIVAAIFIKEKDDTLVTRNTSIAVDYQGNGFSHVIKDHLEDMAHAKKLKRVVNYCPFDNFRMISLNERHHYSKTGKTFGKNNEIVEWEKKI